MRNIRIGFVGFVAIIALSSAGCAHRFFKEGDPKLSFPQEKNLTNLRQLTFDGTNAEAYWSFAGDWLSFQRKSGKEIPCDQIFAMRPDGSELHRISNGEGRTTCAYFHPDDKHILFSSTHEAGAACPVEPDKSRGYVWPIYPTWQMYTIKNTGKDTPAGKSGRDFDLLPMEPGAPRAYNAEATVCKDGSVIFTSTRDGDLELYTAKLDPMGRLADIKRITNAPGYDGGAFFSTDCRKIVWRASRPKPGRELDDYRALLKDNLVRPSKLEIFVADADGKHARQITRLGAASFAPYFTPDNQHVLFSSNAKNPRGGKFDIYRVRVDGTGLEQITHAEGFDGFPMFSPDGKHLAFSSTRNAKAPHDINVFVADWVETPSPAPQLDDDYAPNRYMALVQKLSSDELQGRGIGTTGMTEAENIIQERFQKIGLKPFFDVFKKVKGGSGYKHDAEVRVARDKILSGHNVVGVWGQGCPSQSPVVLGAHLDHLGMGAENSLEPTKKGIHHGADDNASGVAAVVEAARMIVADPASAKGCFVFAAFTGEEVGIGGSSRLAETFKAHKINPKAMLNFDMVGRLENNKVIVYGTDSSKEWKEIVAPACEARALQCPGGGDGYGPSDHMAFFVSGAPVLHFFTGPHPDYHRVSDTADKINATGGVQVADLAAGIALEAAKASRHFTLVKSGKAPTMGRMKKGNGAYLGTIPDYSSMTSPSGFAGAGAPGGGVRLAGVRQGSPAEQAGVREGDVLDAINQYDEQGKEVRHRFESLEGFMEILTTLKPGERVILEVIRGEGAQKKTLQLPAVVGKRDPHPETPAAETPAGETPAKH